MEQINKSIQYGVVTIKKVKVRIRNLGEYWGGTRQGSLEGSSRGSCRCQVDLTEELNHAIELQLDCCE